ncbi:glutathione S-transferase family protein [Sabulicella rubraurantiaca]|uniref:glutathione S-transferase family protein n=1 Tax=Sabulicella rubraurantiaca TaxID=2811429 RepID=UPI001A978217|nr:glutathione S-transferase family protein [Sabulicella rubraurantiaca]
MKLVGRMLSPFVRRVAVTLNFYGMEWESVPLSVVTEWDKIREVNPLGRVPALILDGGEMLVDSSAILDHLDEEAGDEALMPRSGAARREAMRATVFALGAMERTVAAFYEGARRPEEFRWQQGIANQIATALAALRLLDERLRSSDYLALGRLTQADVTTAVLVDFIEMSMPKMAGDVPSRVIALRDRLKSDERFASTRF